MRPTRSKTLRLHADQPGDLQHAAEILRRGGLVAFPTETVYGLGASALSPAAVARIFAAKQRPAWDPLIVHIGDLEQLEGLARVEDRTRALAAAFWPGPLTLLLPRTASVPDEVTAGRPTVGVRLPAHPVARALLQAAGVPVAAPSANRFGHVSPTTAQHVLDDLDGRIDAVLDGGATDVGVESTVLDPGRTPMVLYRAGAITLEMLEGAGFAVERYQEPAQFQLATQAPASLPSPGVGLRHYAPEAQLILCGPTETSLQESVAEAISRETGRVGVLLPVDWQLPISKAIIQPWGRWEDAASLAAGLFAGLRALEGQGIAIIVCPLPQPGGLRDALRDRLRKAATPRG